MKAFQMPMFDLAEGQRRRDLGLERVTERNDTWIAAARETMVALARQQTTVTSDDVWKYCPPPSDAHPSVMGGIFKDDRFFRTGTRQSKRPSAHARWISEYELKEAGYVDPRK